MSKIGQLGERLKLQIQAEQEFLVAETNEILNKHEENLKKLSESALNTTQNAIQNQTNLIEKSLITTEKMIESSALKMVKATIWAMLVPILATMLLCIMIVIGTWLYLPTALFQAQTVEKLMENGQVYLVILNPNSKTCEVNKQKYPCIPK